MEKFILKYFNLLRTIIAVLIGIVISVFLIFLISRDPGFSLQQFLLGPLLSRSRFSSMVEMASPIIMCGLAIAVAFQARQFNVGAEGALYGSQSPESGEAPPRKQKTSEVSETSEA